MKLISIQYNRQIHRKVNHTISLQITAYYFFFMYKTLNECNLNTMLFQIC